MRWITLGGKVALYSLIKGREEIREIFCESINRLIEASENTVVPYLVYDEDIARKYDIKNAKHIRFPGDSLCITGESSRVSNRRTMYQHLANLRNFALDTCRKKNPDYIFSLDSDILIRPTLIDKLISFGKDAIASLVVNDVHIKKGSMLAEENRHSNFGKKVKNRYSPIKRYQMNNLLEVDSTGACFLQHKNAFSLGIKYGVDSSGEDSYYCFQLRDKVNIYVSTGMDTIHVMDMSRAKEAEQLYRKVF